MHVAVYSIDNTRITDNSIQKPPFLLETRDFQISLCRNPVSAGLCTRHTIIGELASPIIRTGPQNADDYQSASPDLDELVRIWNAEDIPDMRTAAKVAAQSAAI